MKTTQVDGLQISELTPASTHERLVLAKDESSGLNAVISIHSTKLGPAAGGCRMFPYGTLEDAIDDVQRLSRGMTFKNAAADLALGGGKSVIIGDPKKIKTPDLMRAFGHFVNSLNGQYFTAEDVGISPEDLAFSSEVTEFVAGLDGGEFASGDPSPYTAQGVINCMEVAWSHRHVSKSLSNVTVAIQGLGHVGMHLARKLSDAGARLVVCDLNETRTELACSEFSATVVPPSEIQKQDADIFAPCAMGGAITDTLVSELKAEVIVGAANNQLATSNVGLRLKDQGILYAPDYIVNGGGIVNVAMEILKVSDPSFRASRLEALTTTLRDILVEADATGKLPHVLADEMIERRLSAA